MTGTITGHAGIEQVIEAIHPDGDGIVRVPSFVKGRAVLPPPLGLDHILASSPPPTERGAGRPAPAGWRLGDVQVVPGVAGGHGVISPIRLFGRIEPAQLVETDLSRLQRELYDLPFEEVVEYVRSLRRLLSTDPLLRQAAAELEGAVGGDGHMTQTLFALLPQLLDPEAFGDAVDRELGDRQAPGRAYLDGWVPVGASLHQGVTTRLAERFRFPVGDRTGGQPRTRAMPTRQLHITAGNSPMVPFVSTLRAWASKGAAVVKSPAHCTGPATLLALAMQLLDPEHPITRHTSLVYWKGGDREVEDVLFAPGAFDRIVVWGSSETVDSVALRAGSTRTVGFGSRYGVSFIGREAFEGGLGTAAARAACDVMIANQQACMSSLVQYVEATPAQAIEYCAALQEALADWDGALSRRANQPSVRRLRLLRRSAFIGGTWFENSRENLTTSSVVYLPHEFDIALHPQSTCVVVRAVDDLRSALRYIHDAVSTVGVYPESRREELRDALGARGVSNVFPLGECERVYAGMPHDGRRVLSELVNWTNG